MAHAFRIMDSTNVITTYTDYDDIPLATLKHVISFIPDLGTEEQANEILLEPESTVTDNVSAEDEVGLKTVIITDAGDNLIMEPFDNIVGDVVGVDHYHPPVGDFHVDGDGHTEEEHREIALWNFKLQTLITQENTNASSN